MIRAALLIAIQLVTTGAPGLIAASLPRILAAQLNDSLHVAALGSNESPGHLELLLVGNLDVKSA